MKNVNIANDLYTKWSHVRTCPTGCTSKYNAGMALIVLVPNCCFILFVSPAARVVLLENSSNISLFRRKYIIKCLEVSPFARIHKCYTTYPVTRPRVRMIVTGVLLG